MWRTFDDFGNLKYSFIETVIAMHPAYVMRAVGGMVFLSGVLLMAYNIYMTIRQGQREAAELEAKLAAKLARAGA
jgi:cytochrome c oxidase cbb3-type subunit 1